MRLRLIVTCDFRKNEQTNFVAAEQENKLKLKAGDVVLLVARGGKQLCFVHGFSEPEVAGGERPYKVLRSEKLRITGGAWNPLRLANYAADAGIDLVGLKRFEEHYERLVEERSGR